jgi:DNA-binding transcriptional LysR family regulator
VTNLRQCKLERLLPEWEPESIELYALYPSRLSASPKVRALLEFLQLRCNDAYQRKRPGLAVETSGLGGWLIFSRC